jgi:hypothetical protein
VLSILRQIIAKRPDDTLVNFVVQFLEIITQSFEHRSHFTVEDIDLITLARQVDIILTNSLVHLTFI